MIPEVWSSQKKGLVALEGKAREPVSSLSTVVRTQGKDGAHTSEERSLHPRLGLLVPRTVRNEVLMFLTLLQQSKLTRTRPRLIRDTSHLMSHYLRPFHQAPQRYKK